MRFDDLASNAGERAAEIGRRAERPSFSAILGKHRRRTLVATWTTSAVVVLVILGVVLVTTGDGLEPPVAAPVTTTTTNVSTTTSSQGTTTIAEEPTPPSTLTGREDCSVTTPGDTPFTPEAETPELIPPTDFDADWYGTPELWTWVHEDGMVWEGLPVSTGGTLTQKTFWWSVDLVIADEPEPNIDVVAELVDGSSTFEGGRVTTGGNADQGTFAIVGLDFPQPGCWSITAEYRGASVSYVAWVDGR